MCQHNLWALVVVYFPCNTCPELDCCTTAPWWVPCVHLGRWSTEYFPQFAKSEKKTNVNFIFFCKHVKKTCLILEIFTPLFSLHKIKKVLSLQTANQKRAAHKRKIRRKIEQRCQLCKILSSSEVVVLSLTACPRRLSDTPSAPRRVWNLLFLLKTHRELPLCRHPRNT